MCKLFLSDLERYSVQEIVHHMSENQSVSVFEKRVFSTFLIFLFLFEPALGLKCLEFINKVTLLK